MMIEATGYGHCIQDGRCCDHGGQMAGSKDVCVKKAPISQYLS